MFIIRESREWSFQNGTQRLEMVRNAALEAHYNEETDEIELYQFRTVVDNDDVANDQLEIALGDAQKLDSETVMGDALGVRIDTTKFGRIAAQSAKQIIVQKVRDAERAQIFDELSDVSSSWFVSTGDFSIRYTP